MTSLRLEVEPQRRHHARVVLRNFNVGRKRPRRDELLLGVRHQCLFQDVLHFLLLACRFDSIGSVAFATGLIPLSISIAAAVSMQRHACREASATQPPKNDPEKVISVGVDFREITVRRAKGNRAAFCARPACARAPSARTYSRAALAPRPADLLDHRQNG